MASVLECINTEFLPAARSASEVAAWIDGMDPNRKAMLRPMAETIAMLDGNAFFGNEWYEGRDWWEQYLPEAHATFEANGGMNGWAGEASFAKEKL